MPPSRCNFATYRVLIESKHIEILGLAENYIESAKRIYRQDKGYCMEDNKNVLREDSIAFAIEVYSVCEHIKGISVYVSQLLRSSSSIGANIHEAKYAQSRADFINKLEISLKESAESEYWLELIFKAGKISSDEYKELTHKCGSIRRRLIASITTAKANSGIENSIK